MEQIHSLVTCLGAGRDGVHYGEWGSGGEWGEYGCGGGARGRAKEGKKRGREGGDEGDAEGCLVIPQYNPLTGPILRDALPPLAGEPAGGTVIPRTC